MQENNNIEEKVINVLVVDDEEIIRDLFKRFLPGKKTLVQTAETGQKALEIAKEKPLDLVFLDIRMPGMNGLQTFRELKKINPDITCVIMTGYADQDLIDNALKEGAMVCLKKPFGDIKDIHAIVEKAFRDKTKKAINVLIVDDEEVIRSTLTHAVKIVPCNIHTAENSKETFEVIKRQPLDLIFLDLKLAGEDGLEIFEKIKKEIQYKIPVVIISGYLDEKEKEIEEARKKGVFGVVPKPFDINKIKEIIEQVTREKV